MGAVITFNDAGTITRGEHKIRGKGIKGFQASYSFKDIKLEDKAAARAKSA
nr:hypothetical protein [Enterocloster clostridioformis]